MILMNLDYSYLEEHPMTFRRENFNNAMCNSQKPAPAPDGQKKTTSDSADYYDGSSKPTMDMYSF